MNQMCVVMATFEYDEYPSILLFLLSYLFAVLAVHFFLPSILLYI
jgi:hypothetical protein